MNTGRFPWTALFALAAGIGLGLVYSWMLSPVRLVDAPPEALRADFKDQYRSAIAAAYSATGDLERARTRLSLLNEPDPAQVLTAQAQRMVAGGASPESVQQVANLALALQGIVNIPPSQTATLVNTPGQVESTNTATPSPDFTPTALTIEASPTPAELATATSRPTRTPTPTLSAPYQLVSQDSVCDPNIADGLIQIVVIDAARRQIPGAEIIVTWSGGEEHVFTGFKPELGHGYADFLMTPNVNYSIRMADGGTPVSGLSAPACTASDGSHYFGSIRISFQKP